MQDHQVDILDADGEQSLRFAPIFNAAVAFIDRHIDVGRTDKPAIVTVGGEQVSYGQLAERVNRCGNALLALGIAPGDRLIMIVKDCPSFFYAFWGAIKVGIVPVPVNTLLRAADHAYMVENASARALVYSPEYGEEVAAMQAQLTEPLAQAIVTVGAKHSLESMMDASQDTLSPARCGADDDCFWLYSSGSTGKPKAVVHRQRDMVFTSQYYGVGILGLNENDKCFSAAKLFFAYGLGNGLSFPLWVGATAVLDDARPTPQSTFDTVERYRPTVYFGVPTLYAAQLQALEAQAQNLTSLRLCVSAGEALPAEIYKRWRGLTGLDILDGVGSTEALHIYISNCQGEIEPGSSGRLVPGYSARIIDEQGLEVAAGESGRLWVKGGSIARCYWNNEKKTQKTMRDGWLDTGDTYRCDERGYYHYCGRNDDMLKVGGIWCSPFEIEATLVEHPAVLEAAVVARADRDKLIKPAAYIVLKDPASAKPTLQQKLREHCQQRLAPYKYPRWFIVLDELPKTATGKIQRFKLRIEQSECVTKEESLLAYGSDERR